MAKKKLPKRILPLPCPDKVNNEKWDDRRDMLDIPAPFRAIIIAPPDSGKTTTVINMMLRANPSYERLYVIHCDPEYTTEYDRVGGIMLNSIPSPDEWPGDGVKTLVVLEDLEYKSMDKEQKHNLDRLFGYVSTHKFTSVILCAQDAFNVPVCARRCASLFILYKSPDLTAMAKVATKTGMKANDMADLFKDLKIKGHESLWIDLTKNTPFPLRKSGYQLIESD